MIARYFLIIIAAVLVAFIVTPFTLMVARRTGFVDRPGTRKIHLSPIPVLGGLAIYAAFLVSIVLFGQDKPLQEMLAIAGGATLVMLVGLWDDRYTINPRLKLLGQIAAGLLLVLGGVQTRIFNQPWVDVSLTLIWVVGISNAVNFLDNMDGLAAGVAAAASGGFLWLAVLNDQALVASLAAAVFGACAGFLFYNFQPAVTFMGDAGALTLGFLLAVLGIELEFAGRPPFITWMIPVIVLGLPVLDTTLVTLSRMRRGLSVAQGGVDHVSHRIARLGLSQRRTVVGLYVVGVALDVAAVIVSRADVTSALFTILGLIVLGLMGLWMLEDARLLPPPPRRPGLKTDFRIAVAAAPDILQPALQAALELSRDITVIVGARGYPIRAVREALVTLAEAPEAAGRLLPQPPPEAELPAWLEAANYALRLRGRVLLSNDAQAPARLRSADLILIGPGEADGWMEGIFTVPAVLQTLGQLKRPRVLLAVTPEKWQAQALQARVTHIVSPQPPRDDQIHRYLVSDLTQPAQVANALAQVWLERRRPRE